MHYNIRTRDQEEAFEMAVGQGRVCLLSLRCETNGSLRNVEVILQRYFSNSFYELTS